MLIGGLLAGVVFVVLAGVLFVTVGARTVESHPIEVAGNTAAAQYVAGLGSPGFNIDVRSVERDAQLGGVPAPPSGMEDVRVTVAFTNTSHSQQRADRRDFRLQDADGLLRAPITGGDACPAWPMTDLHVTASDAQPPRDSDADQVGPSFGPAPLCFQALGAASEVLRLRWDPDVSAPLLSSPVEIALH